MLKVLKFFLLTWALFLCTGASTANERTKRLVLTQDNTVVMDSEFNEKSVAEVMLKAQELDARLPSRDPIYLVINSGGGSIEAGLELIENLKNLNRPVHTVTLFGASMAFQTAQGLGTRYLNETSTLMSHKAKGEFGGEFPGQFDSRYGYYLKRVLKLDEVVVARSGGKLTLEKYRAMYANELWCEGQECIDIGVADQVVGVSCDKSLNGTRTQKLELSFLGMPVNVDVVKAACPTITGILKAEVKVKGIKTNLNDMTEWKTNPVLRTMNTNDIRDLQRLVNDAVSTYDSAKRTVKEY